MWKFEQALLSGKTARTAPSISCCFTTYNLLTRTLPLPVHVFVSAYRRCVSHLLSVSSSHNVSSGRVAPPSFLCAVRGVCRMLSKGHHFNCRKELVECVVPLLNHRLPVIRRLAADSVVAVFIGDQQGDAIADCVRVIAKIVKRKRQSNQQDNADGLGVERALLTRSVCSLALCDCCLPFAVQCGVCRVSCWVAFSACRSLVISPCRASMHRLLHAWP